MKAILKYIALASTILLTCQSCLLSRVLKADNSQSDISVQMLTELYHPDGIIEMPFHSCSVDGPSKRRLAVYLPADYHKTDKSYPVVYLLHGARGNESSWIDLGCMTEVVDSLRRLSAIPDAIYVMPNMNQYSTEEEGLHSTFKAPINALMDTDGTVETGFIKDVVGFIDSHYRTIADKEHRHIAGLSIGSFQSIFISAHHPEYFNNIGLFSVIFKSPVKKSRYSGFYNRKELKELHKIQFNQENCPRMYLIMIGSNDFYFFHSEYFRQYLTMNNYPFECIVTGGGHNWNNWTDYLGVFLQKALD